MNERPSTTTAVIAFLTGLLIIVVTPVIIGLFRVTDWTWLQVLTIILELAAFALPVALLCVRRPAAYQALRMRGTDLASVTLAVIAALFTAFALTLVSTYWSVLLRMLGVKEIPTDSLIAGDAQDLMLLLFSSALIPACCEELMFRGLLFSSLEPYGTRRAVVISGVLFALLHLNFEALPAHLFLGIVLALLVLCTDNLTLVMVFHGVYNAALLVTAFLAGQGASGEGAAMPTLPDLISSLPFTLLLFAACVWLLYAMMRRGARLAQRPPERYERLKLPRGASVLLAITIALLVTLEIGMTAAMMFTGA